MPCHDSACLKRVLCSCMQRYEHRENPLCVAGMFISTGGYLQGIRQSDWENREFAKVRKLLNEAIVLETPYYDITRVNADEDDDEEAAIQVCTALYYPKTVPNACSQPSPCGWTRACWSVGEWGFMEPAPPHRRFNPFPFPTLCSLTC